MRWSVAVAASVASLGLGAGLVACIDLFHTTDDVLTACQLDGAIPECGGETAAPVEAGPPEAGPTDFCDAGWSHADALRNAKYACAWLGACESPLGRNAFGECTFQALLAYDCTANPNHPVRAERHRLWDCMWQVKTCDDVSACVFPGGPNVCGGGIACAKLQGADGVRIECVDGGNAPGENCAMWGQTCNASAGVICAGSADVQAGCANPGCDSAQRIHFCPDGGADIGVDCTGVGAGECLQEPPGSVLPSWTACSPSEGAGDAGTCAPDASAACDSGVAFSCASGMPERIDCATLLGGDAGACTPGPLNPSFDFASPCYVDAGAAPDGGAPDAGPDADVCALQTAETCDAGAITSRTRGVAYSVRCSDVHLGATCAVIKTDVGAHCRAQCGLP